MKLTTRVARTASFLLPCTLVLLPAPAAAQETSRWCMTGGTE
jgi:hypothetical protein